VFNKRTLCIEESVHVLFDESNSLSENDAQDEDFELGLAKKDFLSTHEEGKNSQEGSGTRPVSKAKRQGSKQTGGTSAEPCLEQKSTNSPEIGSRTGTKTGPGTVSEPGSPNNQAEYDNVIEDRPVPRTWKHQKSHPLDQILTDLNSGVQTRSRLRTFCAFYAFLSHIEPKNIYEALIDSDWISAMQEELHQFERNQVWHFVPKPKDRTIISTKWVFRNKLDEQGTVTRNKARLVFRVTIKKKALIMNKYLLQLQELRLLEF